MTSISVWLLVISSSVWGNAVQVQAPYFVNVSDCEAVGKAADGLASRTKWQCVQAFVFVEPKPKAVPQPGSGK
jgi:hypothetical protein